MRVIKYRFTIIELVTASTLMLIMFMIIGYVFGSVSNATASINDKITEGLKANQFFNQLADDVGSSFPVFYLGDKSIGGNYVNIAMPSGANPSGPNLPGGYATGGIDGVVGVFNVNHNEFIRCVTTNHQNGGLLNSNGYESIGVNDNIDQNDKPVRYVTYNLTGQFEMLNSYHARTVYRRDFPLRPDLRKRDGTVRGGYAAGSFIKVGLPGDGENTSTNPADGDINETVLLDGVWEIRTAYLDTNQNDTIVGFGKKVLVKVTIEYAFLDISKAYGDPLRYTQHANADIDGNGLNDRKEHTYTTVIVVNRSNWEY